MRLTVSLSQSMPRAAESGDRSGASHVRFAAVEAIILAVLAILSVVVKRHPGPLPGDVGLELDVQKLLLHSPLTAPIEAVSTVNWPIPTAITLAVVVVLFLVLRRWLDAIVVPLAAVVSSGATFEISRWVHRARPSGHGIHPLQFITHTYSYPSGHVQYAVTVFGLFLFLSSQIRRAVHPALVWVIRFALIVLILLMPVSRILEAEHWPSDVLAGALDGLFWLIIFAHVYLWARSRWPGLLARDER